MGTFAGLFQKAGSKIPEEKQAEFQERVEKLFQAGGMMELKKVELYDKEVCLIKKASIHEHGMDFFYNYFEDEIWENAGLSLENCHVWSGKIGWRQFRRVVVAAYVLETIYLDGPAIATVDGEPVTSGSVIGWLNHLFGEQYPFQVRDPWKLFEAIHEQGESGMENWDWEEIMCGVYGVIGYCEIEAVQNGTDAVLQKIEEWSGGEEEKRDKDKTNFFDCVRRLKKAVRSFREKGGEDGEEQLALILERLRVYYACKERPFRVNEEDENLKAVLFWAALSDAPAYVVKVLAEAYGKDFWELWDKVRDVAEKRRIWELLEDRQEAASIPTAEYLRVAQDDMIPFWKDDGHIRFSVELEQWFADLRGRYDHMMEAEPSVGEPLKWILEIMAYADKNYYLLFTFADFFEETLEHLTDRRYLALWSIYDAMIHDPEMEEAGRAASKVTLRRYMALVANRELREAVFGF